MPVYDFVCPNCNEEKRDEDVPIKYRDSVRCECGFIMDRLPCAPLVSIFPEGVFEHIGPDPVYVHDKPHLKRLVKQHKVHAPGLLDGGDYGREI